MDSNVPLVTLLRQAKVAASKLRLPSLESWIDQELSGYENGNDVPDYRILVGRPVAFNQFRGWIPIILPTPEMNEALSTVHVCESVASLGQLNLDNGPLHRPLPTDMIQFLNSQSPVQFGNMVLELSGGQIAHILESTRGRVLDWALKLEEAGVTGQGISFSDRERQIAQAQPMNIHIQNHGTMVGAVGAGNTASGISVEGINVAALASAISQISGSVNDLVAAGVNERGLRSAVDDIQRELHQDRPDRNLLRGRVNDLKELLVGAGGNLIAAGAVRLLEAAF